MSDEVIGERINREPLRLVSVAALRLDQHVVQLFVVDDAGRLWGSMPGTEGWVWHRVQGPTWGDAAQLTRGDG